jgi:hypothetical protein
MTQWTSVHLLFCEGPHDAAFLNRLLKKQLDFRKVDLKISELPYPLANVLKQGFQTRAADDLRLDLAKKFFLPDYILSNETTLALIFNYGGDNRRFTVPPFLENVFALLSARVFSGEDQALPSPSYSYIVFADADAIGETRARTEICADLGTIGGSPWLQTTWRNVPASRAVMQETAFGPTGAYIWRKWVEDNGTLEDIVLECLSEHTALQQTLQFLDAHFNWTPDDNATPAQVCALAAKRLKAAFCTEGQRDKPGGSLAVILDQTELLSKTVLEQSLSVQDCASFLRAWFAPNQQPVTEM